MVRLGTSASVAYPNDQFRISPVPLDESPSSGVLVINIKGGGNTFLTFENVIFTELLSNPGASAEAAPYHECLPQKKFKIGKNFKNMLEKRFLLLSRLSFGGRRNMAHDPLWTIDQETPQEPQCFCYIFSCIFEHFVQLISDSENPITQCLVDLISCWMFEITKYQDLFLKFCIHNCYMESQY